MSGERLPAAERDVLACIKRLEAATVREVRESMQDFRPMEHASVLTLMNRLEGKKLLVKEKAPKGKAFIYRPTEESARAYGNMFKDMVGRVFGGDRLAFMNSFFETNKPSAEELDAMEDLLADLRKQQNDGRKR